MTLGYSFREREIKSVCVCGKEREQTGEKESREDNKMEDKEKGKRDNKRLKKNKRTKERM